jgi:hypothetical protein
MGKIVLILWIAAIAFGGYWLGYYQEGANKDITIEMDAKLVPQGASVQIEIYALYASGNKLALDMGVRGRGVNTKGRVIYDIAKKEEIRLLDADKVYSTTPFELVDKSECEPAKAILLLEDEDVTRLPDSKTIAGYRCHAFGSAENARETGKAWYTYEIGLGRSQIALVNKLLRMKENDGFLFGGGTSGKKRTQISHFDYFPIPLSAHVRAQGVQLTIDVKSIARDKIAKSVFEVPSGYNKVSSQEMQKRTFGGLLGGG